MPNIRKILVPVTFTEASTDKSLHLLHQAAWLARRFDAEIVLLHVVSPLSYPAGVLEGGHQITAKDLHAQIIQRAQNDLDRALPPELDGISITRLLLRGDPAREIVATARDRNIDIILMATHGHGSFYRLLPGSVTAKVLHETECPVWTGAHLEDVSSGEFAIRRILCSLELEPHSRHTLAMAAQFAAAVDAALTLIHVTVGVEDYGPGGLHENPEWKEQVIGYATREMEKLQKDAATNFDVIIDSGNIPDALNRAARETKADVMVLGHIPGRSHLGDNGNGYGLIRQSRIPVLSV